METKQVKEFYNTSLQASEQAYEQDRWQKNTQARAGYKNTKSALHSIVPQYLNDKMTVLELGPGPGTWTRELLRIAPEAAYDLVDISEEMLKQAQHTLGTPDNIGYIVSDILDFTPQKQYDFFFSSRILEYVPEKQAALATVAAAMKSGACGYLVTKTPQYNRGFGKPVTSPVHQTQIAAPDLVKLLEANGLQVLRRVHVTCVFPGMRSGMLDMVLTKICRLLPFSWCSVVSESYALVFKK